MVSLVSGKLGAVNLDSMLEQCGRERMLKKTFWLTVVDGQHRRSCIQGRTVSFQPGSE